MKAGLEEALLMLVPGARMQDREIERQAGLPQAFLAKARRGSHRSPRSAGAWSRLGLFLAQKLGRAAVDAALTAAGTSPPSQEPDELGEGIMGADTPEKGEALLRRVVAAVATGRIDARRGDLLIEALRALRRSMREGRAEAQRASLPSLQVLTPDEAEALARFRAGSAVEVLPAAGLEGAVPAPETARAS